jgi:hypothetical protein
MRKLQVVDRLGREVELPDGAVIPDGYSVQVPLPFKDSAAAGAPYPITDADRQRCVDARAAMIDRLGRGMRNLRVSADAEPEPEVGDAEVGDDGMSGRELAALTGELCEDRRASAYDRFRHDLDFRNRPRAEVVPAAKALKKKLPFRKVRPAMAGRPARLPGIGDSAVNDAAARAEAAYNARNQRLQNA